MIDPSAQLSKHFTYHEALWLRTWLRLANAGDGLTDQVLANLGTLLGKVDELLDHFGWKARVHCCYRPAKYNAEIGGAHGSAHMADRPGVAAIDFDVEEMTCGDAIDKILQSGLLEKLGLRCENNGPRPTWLHLDCAPVPLGGHRYFKP